jgi:large repetitive protein
LGNGDGTLRGAVPFTSGSIPVSLALADFNGDGRLDVVAVGGSSSTAVVMLGAEASTSAAIGFSQNPATSGQPVTITATVAAPSPYFGQPTGTVTFFDGGSPLAGGVALSGGTASYTTSALASGTHTITVVYSGDGWFVGSSAPASNLVVQ